MQLTQEMIYSIVFMAILIIGILLTFLLGKPVTDPAKLHKRVFDRLNSYARPRKYRVLNNVSVETKNGTKTVDHILVGSFGMLFVNDLLLDGDYYGQLTDERWACNKTDKQTDTTTRVGMVENPLLGARACMDAAVALLTRHGIYNVSADAVAVKAHKKGEFIVTNGKGRVFTLRSLGSCLRQDWIEKNDGQDADKICAILEGKA